eukprot:482691-Hanusia_phi.AAC.3
MAFKSGLAFAPSGFGLAKLGWSSSTPALSLRSSTRNGLLTCQASAEDLAQKMIKGRRSDSGLQQQGHDIFQVPLPILQQGEGIPAQSASCSSAFPPADGELLRAGQAKSTLDGLGVKYEAMELDKRDDGSDIQDYMLSLTGARSVPRVFVGGKVASLLKLPL